MRFFKQFKYQIISSIALAVVFVAQMGANAPSVLWNYQPEIPQELRK